MARVLMCSLGELLLMKTGSEGGEGEGRIFGTMKQEPRKEGRTQRISAEKPR